MTTPSSSSLPCLACDESFADESQRKRHRMQSHRDLNVACFCVLCGEINSNKFEFHEHFRESHSEQFAQLLKRITQRTGFQQIKNQLWITESGLKVLEEEGEIMAQMLAINEQTMNEMDQRRIVKREISEASRVPAAISRSFSPREETPEDVAFGCASLNQMIKDEPNESEGPETAPPPLPMPDVLVAPPRQPSATPSATPSSSRPIGMVKPEPPRGDTTAAKRPMKRGNNDSSTKTSKKAKAFNSKAANMLLQSQTAFNGCGFECDHCALYLSPATGRFACMVCPDYDVCTECMLEGVHAEHALVRLVDGDTLIPSQGGSIKLGEVSGCKPRFETVANPPSTTDSNASAPSC